MVGAIEIKAEDILLPKIMADKGQFDDILGLVYTALAAFSLFYIVRGALLYVTHGGEANTAKEARETILYAIVALVGSTLVFSLIKFVMQSIGG